VRLTWLCCTASPSFSTPHCATLTPGARTIAGSACAHARTHVGHAPHGCRRPPVGRVLQDRLLHALLVPLLRADERRFRHGRVRCVTGGGRSLLLPPCQVARVGKPGSMRVPPSSCCTRRGFPRAIAVVDLDAAQPSRDGAVGHTHTLWSRVPRSQAFAAGCPRQCRHARVSRPTSTLRRPGVRFCRRRPGVRFCHN
jgi:hypothetical protein